MTILGSTVHYTLTGADADAVNRRRDDFGAFNRANRGAARGPGDRGRSGHIGHFGNPVTEGETYPAMVVRAFDNDHANLKVHLDGNDEYWATSVGEGDGPGSWRVPAEG